MRSARPWRTNRARALRANDTSAEAKLWIALRARRLGGFKFVRQAPIGPYFVDFVCRERKFIVEIDGATHGADHEIAADTVREAELKRQGFHIVRLRNEEIFDNLAGVLDTLLALLEEAP